MTECGGPIAIQEAHHKNGSCGTIISNAEIKVMDLHSRKTLGPNQMGEIYVKTASIMNGYYKNPETTKHVFDKDGNKFNQLSVNQLSSTIMGL